MLECMFTTLTDSLGLSWFLDISFKQLHQQRWLSGHQTVSLSPFVFLTQRSWDWVCALGGRSPGDKGQALQRWLARRLACTSGMLLQLTVCYCSLQEELSSPTQRWLGLESNQYRLPGRRWCCLPKNSRESGYPELGGRAPLTADHLLLYAVLHFSWI